MSLSELYMQKTAVSKAEWDSARDNPFGPMHSAKWRDLSKMQKFRAGAGLAANVGFGLLPVVGGIIYLANKARGKEDWKAKYEQLANVKQRAANEIR